MVLGSSENGIEEASPTLQPTGMSRDETFSSVSVPVSVSVPEPSPTTDEHRSRLIACVSLKKMTKQWFRDPLNVALFVWLTCITISGAIIFLVTTGCLDSVIKTKSDRNTWYEVNNQILNALFTLMCLYLHPKRLYHLVLLYQWKPKGIVMLRKEYCKNGTRKPNERTHMAAVVVLLNVNCFAQYVICGLNLGYRRSERPAGTVGFFTFIAILAPTVSGVYSIVSPLGKDYESENENENENENEESRTTQEPQLEKKYAFSRTNENGQVTIEDRPEWKGGLYDVCDDFMVSYLSLFCSCCVFGWNMERLGFGNMYVHIITFLLFCMAPFFIFNLAAVNIDNENVKQAFSETGLILLILGLLYGGFWRIRMRKRFNLPPNEFCFGKSSVTDFAQWLFCCCCSLSQEVRTANFYGIVCQNGEPMEPTMIPPALPMIHRDVV